MICAKLPDSMLTVHERVTGVPLLLPALSCAWIVSVYPPSGSEEYDCASEASF